MRIAAVLLLVAAWVCGGCDNDDTQAPPLETEVILDDAEPPQAGCDLLVMHAFSECRNGTWHVVTRGTFQCGATQLVKEIHVIRTNQPCVPDTQPPGPLTIFGVALDTPEGCASPARIRTFVLRNNSNANWEWWGYDLMQCADGRLFILRNSTADRFTTILSDQPPPTSPVP